MKKLLKGAVAAAMVAAPLAAHASLTAPIDVSSTVTDVSGWVGTAMAAGLGIFGLFFGGRAILRAFKMVK